MLFIMSQAWDKKNCFLLNNSCHCRHVTWNYGEPRKYYGNREYRTKILSERSSHNDSAVQVVQVHNFYV